MRGRRNPKPKPYACWKDAYHGIRSRKLVIKEIIRTRGGLRINCTTPKGRVITIRVNPTVSETES